VVSLPPQTLNQAKEKERQEVFSVPIKRRIGRTPVIEVTFNGNQQFEMIVDTGASGTVITQQMASSLGVVSVGKAKANTASSKAVEFSIGYVDTIEAGGVSVNKVPVAIAGSDLETGLLGHDFFGNYDLTIKRDVVEFRPHEDSQPNSSETQLTVPASPKPRRIVEYP
jgi:predicted aspartyl protease